MATDTIMFKDICPDYASFWNNDAGNMLRNKVVCYSHNTSKPSISEFSEWSEEIYVLLFSKYRNYQIKYDDEGCFLYDLWLDILYHAPNYWARKTLYKRLLAMSDDDLVTQSQSISIFTDHTDSEVNEPLKNVIKSITNQNGNRSTIGTATAVRNYIYHFQYTLDKDFLDKFLHLFITLNSAVDLYN